MHLDQFIFFLDSEPCVGPGWGCRRRGRLTKEASAHYTGEFAAQSATERRRSLGRKRGFCAGEDVIERRRPHGATAITSPHGRRARPRRRAPPPRPHAPRSPALSVLARSADFGHRSGRVGQLGGAALALGRREEAHGPVPTHRIAVEPRIRVRHDRVADQLEQRQVGDRVGVEPALREVDRSAPRSAAGASRSCPPRSRSARSRGP